MVDRYLNKDKPKEVCLETTSACNCRCSFCYNQNSFAKEERKTIEMSTEKMKFIIDKIADSGIQRVRFTGGEPLMRKDIFELAEYAKHRGLETVLNTNGMLIDKEKGKKIVELFDICLISFFTCSAEYLENITNVKNSYDMKIKALEYIQGCKQIWCSTIIRDPKLVDDLPKMHAIMKKYNVHN